MSWLRYLTLKSFIHLNPDWEVILYIEDNNCKMEWKIERQDFTYYKGKNYFSDVEKLNIDIREYEDKVSTECAIYKSDFFRWNMLSNCFYADMDILFTQPMNKIYEDLKNQDVIITWSSHFSIGFLGSSKNSFFSNVYDWAKHIADYKRYQSVGIESLHNEIFNIKGNSKQYDRSLIKKTNMPMYLKQKYPNLNFYNLSMDTLYNLQPRNLKQLYVDIIPLNPKLGIHWYAGHPMSQRYNNIITPNSKHICTLTKAIKELNL